MPVSHPLAVAALVSLPWLLPLHATAQNASARLDPLDAAVNVPQPHYESAFRHYQAASDEQDTPDKTWRAVNDEVGKLGGHVGHVRSVPDSPVDASVDASADAPAQDEPDDHSQHH